jgi:NADH dehydrogenase
MASTLAEMSRIALAHDFRHIDPTSARILLYEAAPRILSTYPEGLSIKAQRHLESLGVRLVTRSKSRPIAPMYVKDRLWLPPMDCSIATFH